MGLASLARGHTFSVRGASRAECRYAQVPPVSDDLDFLAHQADDAVAVAIHDVEPGTAALAVLGADGRRQITVTQPISLGHKVALVDLAEGAQVIEYGEPIGLARRAITAGEHVHVHNIRSTRWQVS